MTAKDDLHAFDARLQSAYARYEKADPKCVCGHRKSMHYDQRCTFEYTPVDGCECLGFGDARLLAVIKAEADGLRKLMEGL